jgi:hypothetical protein
MELPLEKLQVSEIIRNAVSELNTLVQEAESHGLTVDFTARNPRFDDKDATALSVSICQITTF